MKVCRLRKGFGTWIPVTGPDGSILDVNEREARKTARPLSREGYETAIFLGSRMIARFQDGREVI